MRAGYQDPVALAVAGEAAWQGDDAAAAAAASAAAAALAAAQHRVRHQHQHHQHQDAPAGAEEASSGDDSASEDAGSDY
jgi:hypothetical protein